MDFLMLCLRYINTGECQQEQLENLGMISLISHIGIIWNTLTLYIISGQIIVEPNAQYA